jgi:hypothetical protein
MRIAFGGEGRRQAWCWVVAAIAFQLLYVQLHPSFSVAVAHAHAVYRAEGLLELRWELPAQRFARSLGVSGALAWFYVVAQTIGYPVLLGLLYWRRRAVYRVTRNLIIGSEAIGLAVFAAWPVAPPAASGDSLTTLGVSPAAHQPYDLYAAMPSLHLAAAAALAIGVVAAGRSRWRYLVWWWPAAVWFVVLATGNHYTLDAVAGVAAASWCYATERQARRVVAVVAGGRGGVLERA